MIDAALIELEPEVGIVRSCGLLGRSRATRIGCDRKKIIPSGAAACRKGSC